MIDVAHEISSVDRRVGSRTLEAGEARTLTVSRIYDTPPEDLWDACTDPERIARWFLPISGDLRPGGRYELEGNASGTIERCEPPTASTRRGSTAARSPGSSCASPRRPATARASRSSTSPTSRTSSGTSSARAPSASDGIRPSSA